MADRKVEKEEVNKEDVVNNTQDRSKDTSHHGEEIIQECCPNVNRELLVPKLWYFFFFGANGSLLPYLILYFKQLGLSPSQVGIVSGLKPFISFICSGLWGYIADKTQKTKFIYVISLLGYVGGYVGYSLVPANDVCKFSANITHSHQESTLHIHTKRRARDQSTDLKKKRDLLGLDDYFRRKLVPERVRRLPGQANIKTKSARLRKGKGYGNVYQTLYPEETGVSFFQIPASLQILTLSEERATNDSALAIERDSDKNIERNVSHLGKESWRGAVHYQNSPWTVCAAAKANAMDGVNFSVRGNGASNKANIFLFLLVITVIATFFSCPLITIVDTATIRILKETKDTHKYGKQRLWGSLAWGLFSFSVGLFLSLLPLCGPSINEVNYYPSFYIFAALMAIALVIGLKLKFYDEPSEETGNPSAVDRSTKIIEGLKILKEPQYFCFILTSFYIGVVMSIIKTFLFWHLKDMGAPQILFSIISAVNCCAEVFVYYFSSLFIKRVGHIRVMYVALICYALRLFYYGLLRKPWYVLAAEPLSGITTAAAWATMTSYVGLNVNTESVTTMQGILHGVHWGLGHGCGELLGGFMVAWIGAAMTFNIFGTITVLELLLFILVNSMFKQRPSINGENKLSLSNFTEIGEEEEQVERVNK